MKFSLLKLLAVVTWVCLLLGFIAMLAPHPLDWELFWSGWHRQDLGEYTPSYKWGANIRFAVNTGWAVVLVLSATGILIWFIPDGPVSEEKEIGVEPDEDGEAE